MAAEERMLVDVAQAAVHRATHPLTDEFAGLLAAASTEANVTCGGKDLLALLALVSDKIVACVRQDRPDGLAFLCKLRRKLWDAAEFLLAADKMGGGEGDGS